MKVPENVIILGSGKGFLHYRDFNALSTHKVWSCISVIYYTDEVDLIFDPHSEETFSKKPWSSRVINRIKEKNIPVFYQKVRPDYPSSMEFPLKEIVDKFGITYFSGSMCYMIAYAIHIGVKRIDLFGISFNLQKHLYTKGGTEFWLGFAMGKGLKVKVHGKKSKLLKTVSGKLYGYDCDESLKGMV